MEGDQCGTTTWLTRWRHSTRSGSKELPGAMTWLTHWRTSRHQRSMGCAFPATASVAVLLLLSLASACGQCVWAGAVGTREQTQTLKPGQIKAKNGFSILEIGGYHVASHFYQPRGLRIGFQGRCAHAFAWHACACACALHLSWDPTRRPSGR